MPARKPAEVPMHLMKVKQQGLQLLTPLEADVRALRVTTPLEYEAADALLNDIGTARQRWQIRIAPILTPLKEALAASKRALTGANALDAEVDGPLEQMELTVKAKMRDYKLAEARQIQAAAEAKAKEDARIKQELEAALAKAAARPKSPLAQRRVETLTTWAEQQDQTPQEAPVKGTGSVDRWSRKWRVVDVAAVLAGILDGTVPEDVVDVDSAAVGRHFKANPSAVEKWPGFEVYEDVVIARRG